MANEFMGRISARHEKSTTREETAVKLANEISVVVDMARIKSVELKDEYGSRNEVKRQIKKLLQRAEIMSMGIADAAPELSLAVFSGYLSDQTKAMEDSFEIILDNEMLARMLERFGSGIQGNLIVNRLLSPEAIARLEEISDTTGSNQGEE